MKKKILLSLVSLLTIVGCASNQTWGKISASTFIVTSTNELTIPFDTDMSLCYISEDYSEARQKEIKEIYLNKVAELHKLFDRHYNYLDDNNVLINNIKTINDAYASNEAIKVSPYVFNLLKDGIRLTKLTDGYFNLFAGGLTDFWDEIFDAIEDAKKNDNTEDIIHNLDPCYSNSQKALMKNYAKAIDLSEDEIDHILTFDETNYTITFNAISDLVDDGETLMRSQRDSAYRPYITVGGIAKGYATDILKETLVKEDFTHGYLNSGTSSFSSLSDTNYINDGYQTIYLTDPRSVDTSREAAYSFNLQGEYNLSTSGVYNSSKSYTITDNNNNKLYRDHIVNPYTGESAQYHQSVTLVSHSYSSSELDALSTAFINLSDDDGFKFRATLVDANHDLSLIYCNNDNNDNLSLIASKDVENTITTIKGVKNASITYRD